MPDYFQEAVAFVRKWEGGLVDHKDDPGGITKYGISLRFLKDFIMRDQRHLEDLDIIYPVTPESIRELTSAQANMLYRLAFWEPQGIDVFPRKTAVAHFDFSVNAGVRQAVLTLQRVAGSPADGIIGPKTRESVLSLCKHSGDTKVADLLCDAREIFYRDLAIRKETSRVFLNGWLNRVNDLRGYLHKS